MPLTTWLNLVCLDAPLVSITWLWLFARTFNRLVTPAASIALCLTAWMIYLADRLADSRALPRNSPRSLRHIFCRRYQLGWFTAVMAVAIADTVIVWNSLNAAVRIAGSVVGILALIHLLMNYSLGGAWPPLPLKEFAVGSLFALGTLVPLLPVLPLTYALVLSSIAFAILCTFNCLSIAVWETELDAAQGKVSFATRFPAFRRYLGKVLIVFALSAALAAISCRAAGPVLGSVSMSSFLLALLDFSSERISRDQRTALADLVLLTPIPVLFLINM
jgi:hypothetical protein